MTLGQRVAFYRRRSGLSQSALGGLVGRSENWVRKVETGRLPLDRLSVIYALARVLNVPLIDLIGDRPRPAGADNVSDVESLRSTLNSYDMVLAVGTWDVVPRGLDAIRADLDRGWDIFYKGRYRETAEFCAALIVEAELAAGRSTADARSDAWTVVADAYQLAVAVLRKCGDHELARVASDRAIFAAHRSGDPEALAAAAHWLAGMYLSAGHPDQSLVVVSTAIDMIKQSLPGTSPARPLLVGALTLPAAIAAARESDRGGTWEFLDQAEASIRALPPDAKPDRSWFTPTNFAMHRVHAAVELGQAGEALRLADEVDHAAAPPGRISRYQIDLARAHNQRRNTEGVLLNLLDAERTAPEDVRTSPLVRQLMNDCLRRQRGRRNYRLMNFAGRVGLLAG